MKDYLSKSIKSKITKIALELKIPFNNIKTLFLLERMSTRLTKEKNLLDTLIFKGGYIAVRIFNSPRFTTDLDTVIRNTKINEIKPVLIKCIESNISDGVWFKFHKETSLETTGKYKGLRLVFKCGIGELPSEKYILKSQSIHLDVATGDSIIPPAVILETTSIIFDNTFSWQVYSIELSTAEKLHTLITRASENSRSKDVFDLYYFLPKCNRDKLKQAIINTFKARGNNLPDNIVNTLENINKEQLRKGWKNAIATVDENLDFDSIFNKIIEFIKNLIQ